MSFFNKLKGATNPPPVPANAQALAKKNPQVPDQTPLEKHLQDVQGVQPRIDGSDKFFGFENYGSTCYCNSIVQCLYYSAPFREHVISFPSKEFVEEHIHKGQPNGTTDANGAPLSPRSISTTPYPNPNSPARKQIQSPGSPGQQQNKPEESKDSPEYRKKMAIQQGPVLDMVHDNSKKYGMDESLFTSLKDIFEAIISNSSRIGVVSPHKFLEILRRENEMFRSAMHQDAHEFLNLLLNQVVDNVELFSKQYPALTRGKANGAASDQNALERTPTGTMTGTNHASDMGSDTHWVHDLFEGLLTSETRCLTCENTSQRDEAFLDLSVDLSPHTSVTSCLRKFSEEEMLCERNKFHCDNCGGLQEAEKRMKIKRLPRILALHLKRFKYTEDLQRLQKLFHRVVYPFHLRLFNTTEDAEDPDRLYELYAVVVHIGGGPYHGHYVSIIKTQDKGWLLFDDELVEPVSKDYVLSFFGGEPVPGVQDAKQLACAYVLFYQETTLEAVLKEQEAEGQSTPPRASADVPTGVASDGGPSLTKPTNGLQPSMTVQSPVTEEMEHMDPLAHASTAPNIGSPGGHATPQPNLNSIPTPPAIGTGAAPSKSKKELKAEEKARKAAEKEEAKALAKKRQEQSTRRAEAWRKQEEELKQVMELSKQSAVEEARTRGPENSTTTSANNGASAGQQPAPSSPVVEKSGFGRFGRTSMSLRAKPKLFGSKEKEIQTSQDASGVSGAAEQDQEKKMKNRFSLGRKKSALM
ncbi:hypothetical protein MBLNU230_g4996t1 [Neophaeotheca triangularis]